MIVKHIPMETVQKSDFGELVEYMTDPQNKNERVGTITVSIQPSHLAIEVATCQALQMAAMNRSGCWDRSAIFPGFRSASAAAPSR